MKKYLIQQEAQRQYGFVQPYPIDVDETGLVGVAAGWLDAHRLIGFQEGDEQSVVLHWNEFVEDPTKAIGLIPVFAGGGTIFAYAIPVQVVTVIDGEGHKVEHLPAIEEDR